MKVETDYVPSYCDYLTAGKKYKLTNDYIVDDDGVGIEISLLGCGHLEGRDWTIVEPKPFDITKHDWFDDGITVDPNSGGSVLDLLVEENEDGGCYFNKEDSIAFAKHFKLTAEDLS